MTQRFSDEELRSLAVNAMGRGSEAGSLPVMKLGLATNTNHGIVHFSSGNNSGYTVGFFQWDFGQKDAQSARDMVEGYNRWAPADKQIADVDNAVHLLRLHGSSKNGADALEGKTDIRTTDLGHKLNSFLGSEQGYAYVMGLQERQYNEELKPAMKLVMDTPAVKNLSDDDARIVIAAIAKVKNQAGSVDPDILASFQNSHATKDGLLKSIYDNSGKWVDEGVKATVKGASFFNAIANDNGDLGKMFDQQVTNNPMRVDNFKHNPQEQLLDAMFRNPDKAKLLLNAYNKGESASITANSRIENEAYSVTLDKNVLSTKNKQGEGYTLENGVWHENTKQLQQNTAPHAENTLSKTHQTLITDSEKHVHNLYREYGLTVDKGTQNTVMCVAVAAAEQGMCRIDRSAVKDGNINVAQMDGAVATMASVNGNIAANTPVEQSLSKLASIEQAQTQAMNNPSQTIAQPKQGQKIG